MKVCLALCMTSMLVSRVPAAVAIPVPGPDVNALVDVAQIIAVGRIVSVDMLEDVEIETLNGKRPATAGVAGFIAVQTLKGQLDGGRVSVRFAVPKEQLGYSPVTASSDSVVVFLNAESKSFQFASPYYPYIAAEAVPAESLGGSSVDKVAAAIGAVLDESTADARRKREAVQMLIWTKSDEAVRVLRRAVVGTDTEMQLQAAGALTMKGDLGGMPLVEQVLLNPDRWPVSLLEGFRSQIEFGIKSEAAIPSLTRLLGSTDEGTRSAAAYALRRTNSPLALRPLASVLDDSNEDVQYYAVSGLAEISGELTGTPGKDEFRRNPAPHLRKWREWAAARGIR